MRLLRLFAANPEPRVVVSLPTAAILFLGFLLPQPLGAATRVALVGNDEGDHVTHVLDLATVRLSTDIRLELLERGSILRVLREHQLALSGALDAAQAVTLGRLLAADLIAVVETDRSTGNESPRNLSLVVFDARSGMRFVDSALAVTNANQQVDAIDAGIRTACDKQRQLRTDTLRPVCLLTVRNADLPREWDSLCEAVGLLLEREWTASPDLAVLERKRLQHVTQERNVPAGENLIADNWLWSARPFQRVSLDGTQHQFLPSLRSASDPFAPTECFQLLPDGKRALVGDQLGLWLLELGAADANDVTRSEAGSGR